MFVNKKYPFYEFAYRSKDKGYFYRSKNRLYSYYEIQDFIKEKKNSLVDLYASKWAVNEKGERVSGFYFDIDNENLEISYEMALRIYNYLIEVFKLKNGIAFVFSGAKGFHIEMSDVLLGMHDILDDDKKDFIKWFAKKVEKDLKIAGHIDYRVYETKRIWRLEQTINSKTNLFCHRLPNNLIGANLNEILEYCEYWHNYPLIVENEKCNFYANKILRTLYKDYTKQKNEKKKMVVKNNVLSLDDEMPPCVINVLEKQVPVGYRNTTLYVISRVLNKVFRLSAEEIYEFVVSWCFENGMEDREIFPTILSACKSEGDFNCLNSSYVAGLLNSGVLECPFKDDDFFKEKVKKMNLCPVYKNNKTFRVLNRFSETLKKLNEKLVSCFKNKKWNEARETIRLINELHSKILKGDVYDND